MSSPVLFLKSRAKLHCYIRVGYIMVMDIHDNKLQVDNFGPSAMTKPVALNVSVSLNQ